MIAQLSLCACSAPAGRACGWACDTVPHHEPRGSWPWAQSLAMHASRNHVLVLLVWPRAVCRSQRGGVVTRSKAGSSDGGIVCDDDVVLHLDGDEADASVEDGTADVDADASMTLDVSVVEADDEDSGDKSSTGEKSTGASRRSKRLRGQRAGKGLSAAKPRLTRSAAKKSATKGADAKGAAAAPGPTRRVTRSATAAGAGAAASASASASAGRPAKSASKGKGKGKGKASRGAPVAPGAPKMDVKAALERCRTLPDMRGPPELPPGIRDVYDQHRPAARYCAEYIEDIHSNLMRLEVRFHACSALHCHSTHATCTHRGHNQSDRTAPIGFASCDCACSVSNRWTTRTCTRFRRTSRRRCVLSWWTGWWRWHRSTA